MILPYIILFLMTRNQWALLISMLFAPGPRLWDIAYTLYTCVPLSRVYYTESGEAVHYDSSQHAGRIKERVQLFAQSYGKSMDEDYVGMVLLRL